MTSKRILSLDVLRGITVAGMILVNNPGTWGHIYAPLRHAEWIGLTPTDLVFPFFMFIMGISTYISLQKYNFELSKPALFKIVKRTVLIFIIGIAIGWFARFCYYWPSAPEDLSFGEKLWNATWTFDRMRILGVMQRLAICYCVTALIALTIKHKHIIYIIATLLIGYFIILMVGNGYEYNETNILSIVDRAILTPEHMYKDNGIDPEGILSTLPSIAHVLLGFCVGRILMGNREKEKMTHTEVMNSHIISFFLIGAVLTFSGFLLSYACPLNKKIWSPSFVLVTCGMASSMLGLLTWIVDIKGYKRWSLFFESFGVNPLFMYVMGDILSILFGSIYFPWGEGSINIHSLIYNKTLLPLLGDTAASCAYAIIFVLINWCIGYQLYKRKIYIKL